jgi:hypothetical protein
MIRDMKYILILLFLTAAPFQGCTDPDCMEQEMILLELNDTIRLEYGQWYRYCALGMEVQFDSLLSEGRCPLGVECFWEGNAEVRLQLEFDQANGYTFTLNTHGSYRTDTVIQGIRIQLVDLIPYPVYEVEVNPEDYAILAMISED